MQNSAQKSVWPAGRTSTLGNGHGSKTMTANISTSLDADRIFHKLTEAGHTWADREAAADLLEETKKVILAELTLQQLKGASSRAEAEQQALALPAYREHVVAMNAARRSANRARVDYDSLKSLMELRRSQEATRRAEIQLT